MRRKPKRRQVESRHGKIGDHLRWRAFTVSRADDAKMTYFARQLTSPLLKPNISELYRDAVHRMVRALESKYGPVPPKDLARIMDAYEA